MSSLDSRLVQHTKQFSSRRRKSRGKVEFKRRKPLLFHANVGLCILDGRLKKPKIRRVSPAVVAPLCYYSTILLNIKNPEVEALINELVALTGESKTEAVRKALLERKGKLSLFGAEPVEERLLRFLEKEVWPNIPETLLGKGVSQKAQDDLLGFGPEGV